MEKTPTLKTMSTLLMVFPEYRLHNALNFGWGFPLLATLKGCKKGVFIYGNDAYAKTLSNLSLWFLVYGITNACNFKWGISPASNPQLVRKGDIDGNNAKTKNDRNVASLSVRFPEYGMTNANNFSLGLPLSATP